MKEIWSPAITPGIIENCEASTLGKIRLNGEILEQFEGEDDYLYVLLHNFEGEKVAVPVHEIILLTFIPIPGEKLN